MPKRGSGTGREAISEGAARARIVTAARARFFELGYSALTMDDLAAELGMSKKTLYRHFPSKDALVEEIFEQFAAQVRTLAQTVFSNDALSFTGKLHQFTATMVRRFAAIQPHVVRDLGRFAPHIARKLEELRYRNIPRIFGEIFRQGQKAGMVRSDLDSAFAVEFWRGAINGLMQPASLERLGLTPDQAFQRGIDLFFAGFLTPDGRKDYEKHVAT